MQLCITVTCEHYWGAFQVGPHLTLQRKSTAVLECLPCAQPCARHSSLPSLAHWQGLSPGLGWRGQTQSTRWLHVFIQGPFLGLCAGLIGTLLPHRPCSWSGSRWKQAHQSFVIHCDRAVRGHQGFWGWVGREVLLQGEVFSWEL